MIEIIFESNMKQLMTMMMTTVKNDADEQEL